MQMYGNFEGFPLQKCIVWVGNIMTLGCGVVFVLSILLFFAIWLHIPSLDFGVLTINLPFMGWDKQLKFLYWVVIHNINIYISNSH